MKKGFALPLILVIILLSVAVLAGGYYFLRSKVTTQPQLENNSQSVSKSSPAVISSPTPDETANWKTYENSKFGYSIKYPSTWAVDGQDISTAPDDTELGKVLVHTVIISPTNTKVEGIPAGINITKESLGSALKRRQKELAGPEYTTSVSDTKNSAGTPVKKLSFTLKSESGYTDSGYVYFIEESGNTYELSGVGNGPFRKTIELIFETFVME